MRWLCDAFAQLALRLAHIRPTKAASCDTCSPAANAASNLHRKSGHNGAEEQVAGTLSAGQVLAVVNSNPQFLEKFNGGL